MGSDGKGWRKGGLPGDESLCKGIAGDVEAVGRVGKEPETQSLGEVLVKAGRTAELEAGEGRSGLKKVERDEIVEWNDSEKEIGWSSSEEDEEDKWFDAAEVQREARDQCEREQCEVNARNKEISVCIDRNYGIDRSQIEDQKGRLDFLRQEQVRKPQKEKLQLEKQLDGFRETERDLKKPLPDSYKEQGSPKDSLNQRENESNKGRLRANNLEQATKVGTHTTLTTPEPASPSNRRPSASDASNGEPRKTPKGQENKEKLVYFMGREITVREEGNGTLSQVRDKKRS